MTRKHFKKLAEAIGTIEDKEQRISVSHLIAGVCTDTNSRFDYAKFLDAIEWKAREVEFDRMEEILKD